MKPHTITLASENTKIQRLSELLDTLEQQKPVNLYSTFFIIAPENRHNQWRFALNAVRDAFKAKGNAQLRAFSIMAIEDFEYECAQGLDDQHIFMVDEQDLPNKMEFYEKLRTAIQKLSLDDGHRLFMTREE